MSKRVKGAATASKKRRSQLAEVKVVRLAHAEGLPLPDYQTAGAAGLDLLAAVEARKPVSIAPGARVMIPTGLILEFPDGYEGQVRPRSGLAVRHGITVLNAPGTIDSDYRGEVQVILINHGAEPFLINRGERVAQLVIAPVTRAVLALATAVSETKRGAGGFGSTGRGGKITTARTGAKGKSRSPKGRGR
jgi:dUTP pyrophosphatase